MQPRGPHVCCRLSGPYSQRGARQTMAPSCAENNDGYAIASGKHRARTWQVTRTVSCSGPVTPLACHERAGEASRPCVQPHGAAAQ